jgi:hypothetical protein
VADATTEWDEWDDVPDSGPYCRHWDDPSDCETTCARCGHDCGDHPSPAGDEMACHAAGCACVAWAEPEGSESHG